MVYADKLGLIQLAEAAATIFPGRWAACLECRLWSLGTKPVSWWGGAGGSLGALCPDVSKERVGLPNRLQTL